MKKALILLILLVRFQLVNAQITIGNGDMPSVGDTFRVSNGLIAPTIDPVPTGANYTWDFSNLQWVTQDIDTFIDVSSSGTFYAVVFSNLPFNPYRANVAAKGPVFPTVPLITVSDVYYFYYNSSNAYDQSGYGASLNGFPTPIPFNNKDRIYDFPLQFGNIDSSDSDYNISIPLLGYYGHNQRRVNEVDGWGTLITPYGSFNTLRVKSVINAHDSVHVDTLGFGFGYNPPRTTEYKWLTTNGGIPMLQINTNLSFGVETITSIVYRDSARVLPTGLPIVNNQPSVSVFPNPVQNEIMVEIQLNSAEKIEINLTDVSGRNGVPLYSGQLSQGLNKLALNLNEKQIASGVYVLEVKGKSGTTRKQIVVASY